MAVRLKELFGLGAVSDEAIERAASLGQDEAPASWGRYRDLRLENGVTLIRRLVPRAWDENGRPTRIQEVEAALSFDAATEMSFLVWDSIRAGTMETPETIAMAPLSEDRGYQTVLPVHPVHAWMPRSFSLREEVRLKIFMAAEKVRLSREAKVDGEAARVRGARGRFALKPLLGEYAPEGAECQTMLIGEILETRAIEPAAVPGEGQVRTETLRFFLCRTDRGPVSILARESLLNASSRKLLGEPGVLLHAEGYLIGDARTERYAGGAVWDVEEFCSHLRTLALLQCLRVISENLRPSSEFWLDGTKSAEGVGPVVEAFRPFAYGFTIRFARVREVKTGRVVPALLCLDEKDARFRHWIIPEWDASSGFVRRIRIETRVGEFETLFDTADFVRFRNPDAPELHFEESKSEARREAEAKYRFTGDAGAFPDHHDEDASALLAALAESDGDGRGFIRAFLAEGKLDAASYRKIDDVDIIDIEDAARVDEPSLRGVFAKMPGDKALMLLLLAPKLPGLVVEGEVLGTCRWENRVGGEVALAVGKADVTAVVLDFDRVEHLLQPGAKRHFRLSASVESLEIRDVKPIIVKKDPLFERQLEEFLEENPGKSADDFPPIEISTEGMQVLFPKDYSSIFTIASPVLSLKRTMLFNREVVRLEVILHRTEDKEFRIYLYGAATKIPEGLEEGSEILGVIRLYAEPIAETLN